MARPPGAPGGRTSGSASAGGARRGRPPGAPAAPATPARGSAKREDKDSLTVGPRTAVRRLARRGEDKDSPEFLIFPHTTTPPRRLPRPRRAVSAFSRPSSGGRTRNRGDGDGRVAPLVVDADAVLTFAGSRQLLEAIPRRETHVADAVRVVQHAQPELPKSDRLDVAGGFLERPRRRKTFSVSISERLDHVPELQRAALGAYPNRSARTDAPVDTSRMQPLPGSPRSWATREPSRNRPARSTNAPHAHPWRDRP